MALYETVFIARQDVSAKQVEDYAKAFGKIVNDNGGEVKRTESWGLRNLAYKIKKNRKGHYTLLHIEALPKVIVELERNMRLNEDILRYMTVSIDKLPEGPSAILKQSDDDRDGDDRGGFSRERSEGGFSRDRGERSEGGFSRDREDRPKYNREPSKEGAAE
jgi:small subunit ribosomal protein S6